MKTKISIVLAMLSLITICCSATDIQAAPELNDNTESQGCCSSHGGECQCQFHHVICCDGWRGSSCGC